MFQTMSLLPKGWSGFFSNIRGKEPVYSRCPSLSSSSSSSSCGSSLPDIDVFYIPTSDAICLSPEKRQTTNSIGTICVAPDVYIGVTSMEGMYGIRDHVKDWKTHLDAVLCYAIVNLSSHTFQETWSLSSSVSPCLHQVTPSHVLSETPLAGGKTPTFELCNAVIKVYDRETEQAQKQMKNLIMQVNAQVSRWLEKQQKSGKKCLIVFNCYAGMSRAPTVASAFIDYLNVGIDRASALLLFKQPHCRDFIAINPVFLELFGLPEDFLDQQID